MGGWQKSWRLCTFRNSVKRLGLPISTTITNWEVQNLIKHFCSGTTAEHGLKKFSAVEKVDPLNVIPIF